MNWQAIFQRLKELGYSTTEIHRVFQNMQVLLKVGHKKP